ncbi:glycosyltransferase [Thermodesulfobacteriota bacterium]
MHIIDSEGLYGAEVVLLNLALEQKKMGIQPAILNMRASKRYDQSLAAEASKMMLDFYSFPIRTRPDLLGILKIIRFAVSNGYRLFHSHGYKPNIYLGLMPKKIRKLPLVATLHGWTNTDSLTRMSLYEWLDTFSLRFIDTVVLVNKAMVSHPRLRKRRNLNLSVINNGIPLLDFNKPEHFENDEIIAFCNQAFTVGAIGRLSKEKGYDHLIESFHLIIQKGIDARLVIMGDGSERHSLEKLIKDFKLTDKVLLPGYCTDAKNYLPHFNVFVISSLTEGLPITLLEAMQAKVPIVATKVGGIPEVLHNGRAGLLVEPFNLESLAEAIIVVYHHTKFANELTTVAYEKAITDYSSQKMATQYLDIYHRVIQHNCSNSFGCAHAYFAEDKERKVNSGTQGCEVTSRYLR